jgi:LPXTG-motif cell wall-anchored protein
MGKSGNIIYLLIGLVSGAAATFFFLKKSSNTSAERQKLMDKINAWEGPYVHLPLETWSIDEMKDFINNNHI